MNLRRRDFLATSSMAVVAGILWPSAPLRALEGFRELRRGVGLFAPGGGGTIGWLVRAEALLVVDSNFPEAAASCLRELKTRSSRRIDALINTHHHGDHTAGNGTLRDAAARIVAHENVPTLQKAAAERRDRAEGQVYADTTYSDSWRMDVGDETVSLHHYGPAHTGGDSVVHFEKANVIHMGDLVFNRWYPYIDRPGGASVRGWIEVLEKVIERHGGDTRFIFGHGVAVEGSLADLRLQRDYLTAVIESVTRGIQAGKTREEIAAGGLEGFDEHTSPGGRLNLRLSVDVAYDELTDAER